MNNAEVTKTILICLSCHQNIFQKDQTTSESITIHQKYTQLSTLG